MDRGLVDSGEVFRDPTWGEFTLESPAGEVAVSKEWTVEQGAGKEDAELGLELPPLPGTDEQLGLLCSSRVGALVLVHRRRGAEGATGSRGAVGGAGGRSVDGTTGGQPATSCCDGGGDGEWTAHDPRPGRLSSQYWFGREGPAKS